jgi:3-methyladenine DNA glycosylase AlkC
MESIDPWQEFQAMTADEAHMALAFLSGYDEALFARVIERTRSERERRRLRALMSDACRRAGDAEVTQ